jgi:transposase-like protein
MRRRAIAGKGASLRREYWRERIAAQERSGLTIQRFCKEQGLTEQSFYVWRKRLREQQEPMRFALVETGTARPESAPGVEVVLTTGERLRIGTGVDVTVLRKVLEALRA